jgi:hypothetical protein
VQNYSEHFLGFIATTDQPIVPFSTSKLTIGVGEGKVAAFLQCRISLFFFAFLVANSMQKKIS